MPGTRRVYAWLVCLAFAVLAQPVASAAETGFLNRVVTIGKDSFKYQVYVPENWNSNQKWPVILFLHGAGERGDDGIIQTEVGIGTAIRRHVERFPAVVVFPQCRKESRWTDEVMTAQALKALETVMKEFKGDPDRVYLTGISMGGFGTWGIAAGHSKRFAALVPVCGGIRRDNPGTPSATQDSMAPDVYAATATKIGATPTWIFHGDADKSVPVDESRKMNQAIKAAGGNVRYTEYEGVGHNSWDRAYAEPELLTWLLSQHLSK